MRFWVLVFLGPRHSDCKALPVNRGVFFTCSTLNLLVWGHMIESCRKMDLVYPSALHVRVDDRMQPPLSLVLIMHAARCVSELTLGATTS